MEQRCIVPLPAPDYKNLDDIFYPIWYRENETDILNMYDILMDYPVDITLEEFARFMYDNSDVKRLLYIDYYKENLTREQRMRLKMADEVKREERRKEREREKAKKSISRRNI